MKIAMKTGQSRRDFWVIYECEHCGAQTNGTGYDDANFHQNVIPKMTYTKCGKSSNGEVSSVPSVPAHLVL